jgi:hypothetical protein
LFFHIRPIGGVLRALLVALLLGLCLTLREAPSALANICDPLGDSFTYASCVNTNFNTLDSALGPVQGGAGKSLLARSATARGLFLGTPGQPGDPYRAAGLLRGIGHEACGLRQAGKLDSGPFGTIQSSVGDLIDSIQPGDPYKPCVPPNPT